MGEDMSALYAANLEALRPSEPEPTVEPTIQPKGRRGSGTGLFISLVFFDWLYLCLFAP
jgi:hypothetical protein